MRITWQAEPCCEPVRRRGRVCASLREAAGYICRRGCKSLYLRNCGLRRLKSAPSEPWDDGCAACGPASVSAIRSSPTFAIRSVRARGES